jgi:hypothetical protein
MLRIRVRSQVSETHEGAVELFDMDRGSNSGFQKLKPKGGPGKGDRRTVLPTQNIRVHGSGFDPGYSEKHEDALTRIIWYGSSIQTRVFSNAILIHGPVNFCVLKFIVFFPPLFYISVEDYIARFMVLKSRKILEIPSV